MLGVVFIPLMLYMVCDFVEVPWVVFIDRFDYILLCFHYSLLFVNEIKCKGNWTEFHQGA